MEPGEALLAGEPVGHAGDVGDRRSERVGAAGLEMIDLDVDRGLRRLGRNRVRPVGVVLDEGPQQAR